MTTTAPPTSWDGCRPAEFPADPYPGTRPDGSFLLAGDRVRALRPSPTGWALGDGEDLDASLRRLGVPGLGDRVPVLAYGSNANPAKLAALRIGPVVALRAVTTGLAAAWCTDPRRDGQIPATLVDAPEVVEAHAVLLCTPAQVDRLDAVEGRAAGYYHLGVLRSGRVVLDDSAVLPGVLAYVGGNRRQPLAGPTGAPLRVAETDQATAAAWAARRPGACGPASAVVLEVLPPGSPVRPPDGAVGDGSAAPARSAGRSDDVPVIPDRPGAPTMDVDLQTHWTLATGTFPTLSSGDFPAVYRTYGPAFGPWRPVTVGWAADRPVAVLAVGGATDPVAALTAAATDWQRLAADLAEPGLLPPFPEGPTAGAVADRAPHGLLIRHGLVRLEGAAAGDLVPADLPLQVDAVARG